MRTRRTKLELCPTENPFPLFRDAPVGGAVLLIRVYYDDTDAGGVVYYGNYLKYFERARTDLIEALGFSVKDYQDEGIWFTVVHAEIDYRSPATYNDTLGITTRVEEVKRVRFRVSHEVRRQATGELLVTGATTLACVDSTMRPRALPTELADALKARFVSQAAISSDANH